MTAAIVVLACAFVGWIWYEIRRAPVETFDASEYAADSEAAQDCIDASRPTPLDHPHVRAGTAYGREVK